MQDIREGLLILESNEVENIEKLYTFDEIREILTFALSNNVSEYWTILALNFLRKKPEYISDEIILMIKVIIDTPKRYMQKTRHEGLKILKIKT
ncbi:hypothetical protein B9X71_17310 [Acinetobacter baumannii]|uniref:hypothetical protein n=1 Tax=Acinetobacter calcoaceticus/baumannii complex TaxID=909768 RepID=UPI000A33BC6B|nr:MULTISPECIES: hypothetical protein [Acinetobacter calcoaceticus/baumannii complex]EHU2952006.1 hypothetical protein [Acinetobacter baumannii]MCT9167024.1 hypothetical protein [Acinetobacter baumannii]MCT9174500.1 hypothetical protein [Acinetobacter baumannii]MCT9178776.1 hypothetical protein [Acinetobacter baumannii]MDX8239899.1 hypothetical protein [Acinetobacter pittii]